MDQAGRNTTRNSRDDNVIPFVLAPPTAPTLNGGAAEAIDNDERHEANVRALLCLASDVVAMEEATARVAIQVRALAERCGVFIPNPELT
jgi:hypothetical protein